MENMIKDMKADECKFILDWRNISDLRDWLDKIAENEQFFLEVSVIPGLGRNKEIVYELRFIYKEYWEEVGHRHARWIGDITIKATKPDPETGQALPPEI